ncbi:MAG: serine/threonine-protein phosphatase [Planctomycetes bacterium]|nr:serine/threonine-protein phosphatase [Planctomycetota bacterium]
MAPGLNPDGYDLDEHGLLFAVADGAGAHQAGEVASQMAVEELKDYYCGPQKGDIASRAAELVAVFHRVNRAVFEKSVSANELFMMGTTLSALLIWRATALLAHVGDSRIYRLRRGELRQLTADHTEVARMVDEGELTPEDARTHHRRHRLDQVIGGDPELELIGLQCGLVVSGDVYLLCTDGVSGALDDQTIRGILLERDDPAEACNALVDEALRRGTQDNASAIVVRVGKVAHGMLIV